MKLNWHPWSWFVPHEAELASKSGTSNYSAQGVFWKEICNLNIPSKLKHFLWGACNDSLPTKKNLFRQKVTQNSTCECHHEGVEDTIHALWDCQVVKETWWDEVNCHHQLSEHFVNFQDLLTGNLNVNVQNLAERFTYIAWSIWAKRNATRLNSPSLPYSKIYSDAMERL